MRFLKSDLARSFAIGFALGGIIISLVLGTDVLNGHIGFIGAATAAAR